MSGLSADSKTPNAPIESIKKIDAIYSRIVNSGFKSSEEAYRVMASYSENKNALKKADSNPTVTKAQKSMEAFDRYINQTKNRLKTKLSGELSSKMMMAKRWESVANQALKSGSNVPQNRVMMYKQMTNVASLKKEAGIYTAIVGKNDADALNINKKVAYIEQVGVKMGAIDSAVTPRDSYTRSDKETLKSAIEKRWKSLYPKDALLGIRFIDASWFRRTEKRYNNVVGWYDLDVSTLEVKVVIKEDNDIAAICPVFLLRDHLKGDALEIDADSSKNINGMCSKMLIKNYKP